VADPLLFERRGAVALLTLNRPEKHNSLTTDMLELLEECARVAQEDDSVRAVVVTGAGDRAFSTGGDLAELIPAVSSGEATVVTDPSKRFFSDVYKPVIAAVNGLCIAGGFEIMLGTDMRVASATAKFGVAEVRWGVIPGAGTHVRLPGQIPWAIAMQLLLTGEPISAQRAYEVGLINEIVEPESVLPRALELAEQIASNAPIAVQTAKEIAVRALDHPSGFELEYELTDRVMSSRDAREGPAAFTERRSPVWTGT
jgi:enoyl-CoA hydratase